MDRQTFEREIKKAKSFQRLEHDRQNYWMGYQRGLRRRFHGSNFGTDDEHRLWMTANGDESREQRRDGYRDGYFFEVQSITTSDAALVLNITTRRVQALISDSRLPAEKIGRDWVIKLDDLELVRDRKPGRPTK